MKKLLYILLFVPLALFGQENYSLSFDGVDDYVAIPIIQDYKDTTNDLTYSFNFRSNNQQNNGLEYDNCLFSISDESSINENVFRISISYFGNIFYEFVTDTVIYGTIEVEDGGCNDNQWHNLTIVNERGISPISYFYLDGLQIASIPNANIDFDDSDFFIIGAELDCANGSCSYSDFFTGDISDFHLWSTSLSESQINSFIQCSPSLYQNNLGYWDFNEGIGNSSYDLSVNENHGTIYGAVYSTDIPEGISNCIGCKNPDAINYNENAIEEDEESCIYSQDYVHGLWNEVDDGAIEYEYLQEEYNTLNTNSTNSTSSLQQALDTWNTTIDLSAGWNMFGYGCPSSIDVAAGLSHHTESIIITKDNNGNVYMPEFGFNGIGDFTPGFGYQIKLTEAIEGFSLCDWYVNDIPEDNIVSLQEEVENLQSELDCYENPEIGDYCFGGIVFYIDSTGEHGLVAAMEDLGEFQWGCNNVMTLSGADVTSIGTGYQNTLDIVAVCSETPIPASEALAYESEGYSDWYLPSRDELVEMYYTIGDGGPEGNIGVFFDGSYPYYWSSSESGVNNAWGAYFDSGVSSLYFKNGSAWVRVIRSF